jgi:hypothetical protein
MADATGDKAAAGIQPRGIHAGANVVRAKYVAEASHSATDVIQMVKLPNRAIVDDIVLAPLGGGTGEGSSPAVLVVSVGDGVDPNRYYSGSWSSTLVARANMAGIGYQISISDAAAVQFDTVDVTINAGVLSVSQGFYLTVFYHNDS